MVILREGLCPGLTADIITALKQNQVKTVVDLVASDLEEIARKCSLSYKTLVAVRRVLLARYSAFPSNGADLYEELKSSTAIIPTGNSKLDSLLDSGLYTGELTEIAGAAGSGKTQMCQSIAVNVAYSLKQSILYVDTTGGLTALRLLQLVQTRTEQEDEQVASLKRIEVVHVFEVYKIFDVLQDLRHSISQQFLEKTFVSFNFPLNSLFDSLMASCWSNELLRSAEPLRLVIIDSVCSVIYPLLGGKQVEGMAIMMQLARELQSLAHDFNLAVLITNHITKDGASGIRPALGRSWSFVPSTRILLKRQEGNKSDQCTVCLAKSPRQPCNLHVEVDIGSCGILDPNNAPTATIP